MFNRTWRSFLLVAGETALLVAAVVISSIVIGGPHGFLLVTDNTAIPRLLLIVVVCQLSLHYVDLYDLRTIEGPGDLVRRLMRAIGATSLILGIAYWLFPLLVVERGVFLLSAVLAIVMVMLWRSAFDVITRHLARASGCCWSAPVLRRWCSRANCSSGATSLASTSSASSIPIRRASVPG